MGGPAGAVKCEARDLGIKSPQRHTLMCEEQAAVDMKVVCPQDVTKMPLKPASMVHWKKWAAQHEGEELKEGVRLEPIQAMLRRTTSDFVDRQAPTCDEKASRGRRMGAEKILRRRFVR